MCVSTLNILRLKKINIFEKLNAFYTLKVMLITLKKMLT